MAWIEPIYDRTERDVQIAKEYNNGIINNDTTEEFHVLGAYGSPDSKRVILSNGSVFKVRRRALKGALNYWDLNRIENNSKYVADRLVEHGYDQLVTAVKTDWGPGDMPTLAEINRIRQNIQNLLNVYHAAEDMPAMSFGQYIDYILVNNMEYDLYRLNENINRMSVLSIFSGVTESGYYTYYKEG